MQIITIKNDYLQVSVSTLGAELQSVILNGKELIWQGDKNFWRGKAPILFPIAGALKDKQYYLNGVLYDMPFHGFARNNYFKVRLPLNFLPPKKRKNITLLSLIFT